MLARRLFAIGFAVLMLFGLVASVSASPSSVAAPRVLPGETPAHGTFTTLRRPLISVSIEGVDEKTIRLLVNGMEVLYTYDPALKLLTHTPTTDLPLGHNTVEVRAKDLAGRDFSWSWSFTVVSDPPLRVVEPEPTIGGVPVSSIVVGMTVLSTMLALLVVAVSIRRS